MGVMLSCMDAQKRHNERKMAEFAETKRGKKVMNSKRMVKYREKRMRAMQPDVEIRLAEEQDRSKGEQVWFSRYISNGRLRHWVLLTHGNKYELRRSENVNDDRNEERAGETSFTYHVSPFTIDEEKRNAALAETSLPNVDGFYVCLVGWTRLSKSEVDTACQSVFAEFGEYHLLWKNCQHFLQRLAERIVSAKAADYPWFISNTKTRYQKTQHLLPPPLEMLMKSLQQMQMQSQMQVQTQNQLQMQMQNQTQNQMQLQIQNQIQLQMQNQIQQQMSIGGGMGA